MDRDAERRPRRPPMLRQSALPLSNRLEEYSLDSIIFNTIQPILRQQSAPKENLFDLVHRIYKETEDKAENALTQVLSNFPCLDDQEARLMLWKADGDPITCIKNIDQLLVHRLATQRKEKLDHCFEQTCPDERSFVREITRLATSCLICFSPFEYGEDASLSCGHSVCIGCLNLYLSAKLNEGDFDQNRFTCPFLDCKKSYNLFHVLFACNTVNFEKLVRFRLIRFVEGNPRSRWCPQAGCGAILIGEFKTRKLGCTSCHEDMCFRCGQTFHSGRCKQNKLDKSFKKWKNGKAKTVKKCPRCKFNIEKTRGCNHMTCVKCGFEFCWLCLSRYRPNHFDGPFGCSMTNPYNRWGPNVIVRTATKTTAAVVLVPVGFVLFVLVSPFLCYLHRGDIVDTVRPTTTRNRQTTDATVPVHRPRPVGTQIVQIKD